MGRKFRIKLKDRTYSINLETDVEYGDLEIVRYSIYDETSKEPVNLGAFYDDPEEQVVRFLEWLESKTIKEE